MGGLVLGTLAISRLALRAGIPATLAVMLFGLVINTTTALMSHDTIEWLHTLSLSMLLFYAGLGTELRSIRDFLEYGLTLAVGGVLGGMAKPLPKRLQSVLEFESSLNDPAAIFVLGAVVGLFTVSHAGGGELVLMEQI